MKPIPTIILAGLLLICSGCGGDSNPLATPPTGPTGPQTIVVNVEDNSYSPMSIEINTGDTVRWVFAGTVTTHTVTALGGLFDSGFVFLLPGDIFERTFDEVDLTFEYSCQSHQACCSMQGSVKVGSNAPDPQPGY